MQLYEMQVTKTTITRAAPALIPQGIIGAVVKLNFSAEWEGLTKTVVFRAGEVTKDVVDVADTVVIPAECTQEEGALLQIGVYGTDGENTVAIPTLRAAIGRITEATDPSGDETTDPSLPVWAQVMAMVKQLEEQGVTQNEVEQAVRDFFGGELPTGRTTPQGGEIFNDYENNQALAPYTKADGYNNRAGIYGYKLLAVAKSGENYNITVSDANLESKAIDNYAAGDILCFDGTSHYYDVLEITSVTTNADGNSVITVKAAEGKTTPTLAVDSSKDEWENWVYVLDKPDAGVPVLAARGAYAGGIRSVAVGYSTFAYGRDNKAIGNYSHAEGRNTFASYAAHAEGQDTKATGNIAHAEGHGTHAGGNYAHAEGLSAEASGYASHAEGRKTVASGYYAHAEGDSTTASGNMSHAEGSSTQAIGIYSHAEGEKTVSNGYAAHAEGHRTEASGTTAHAEGRETVASEYAAHAEGRGTIANCRNQHAQGSFNIADTPNSNGDGTYAHIVGGGTSDTDRKNIHTLDWHGNAEFAGVVKENGVRLMPQKCTYISGAVSADTITEPFVLLNISAENTELRSLLGGANYAYIQTQYYSAETGWRLQVAWSYAIDPARMAFRTEYQGVWSKWDTFAKTSEIPTGAGAAYIVAETTVSNLEMQLKATYDETETVGRYYFDYTCRKWSDGIIEIFGHSKGLTTGELSYVTTAATKAWGSLYETGAFVLPNYPEQLKSCLYANVSFASITGNAVWAEGGHWGNLYGLGQVYFCRAEKDENMNAVQGNICTYTVGTWK